VTRCGICKGLLGRRLAGRREVIFRSKAIYEELHPDTKQHVAGAHGANKVLGRDASDNLSFASSTAAATGKDRRSHRQQAFV
jgi:hypothetical protein